MLRLMTAVLFVGTAGLAAPASAIGLGEAGELEHARANARAGGPVSERDYELLQRYGCTSGTDDPACHRDRREPRWGYHKRHRHVHRSSR